MPILYGEPVRGADDAALAKARGKQSNPEDEAFLRATWDSGPKGIEKWSQGRLPTGRKVVQSGVGEEKPREPEGAGAAGTLRLKLAGAVGGGSGHAGGSGNPRHGVVLGTMEKSPTPTGTGAGTGIKFRLPAAQAARRESGEGSVVLSNGAASEAGGPAVIRGYQSSDPPDV